MSNIKKKPELHLEGYVDLDRPFSPLDAGILKDAAREVFFAQHLDIFADYQTKPRVVVGRRGAGKTAFLESAYFTNPHDLIVKIDKARALGQVVLAVHGVPMGGRYPEAVAELWDSIVFTRILAEAASSYRDLRITRDYLAKIGASPSMSPDSIAWTFLDTLIDTQKGKTVSSIAELIRRLHNVSYHDAKRELFNALHERRAKAIVLVDSLESEGYIFDDPDTLSALKGLLKWIGDTGSSRDPVEPRLSVPGEYYLCFLEISSNPLKDFAKSSVLKWTPRQLIILAALRFRRFLELTNHPDCFKHTDEDLANRKTALAFLRDYLPDRVTIRGGEAEDSLIHVLRHTQLLPRQFFMMLNALFASRRGKSEIDERELKACVHQAADIVVSEIFGAYNHRHPKAMVVCRRLLPHLPEVFPYGELHRSFNRFARREYVELEDFVEMLIEIGAIGKVVGTSERYVRGQFQYNYDGPLSISSKATLCVHPAFRVIFPHEPDEPVSRVLPVGTEH